MQPNCEYGGDQQIAPSASASLASARAPSPARVRPFEVTGRLHGNGSSGSRGTLLSVQSAASSAARMLAASGQFRRVSW